METPIILVTRTSDAPTQLSKTSQLFTRLDRTETVRESKSSKLPRASSQDIKKHSLNNSKENINYDSYLHKVKSALKIDESAITSKYLLCLRKQFDKMAKDVKHQTSSINTMKKEIDFMRAKHHNQTSLAGDAKQHAQQLEDTLSDISVKQEEAKMHTKTLEHIIERMKEDELKHKNDCRLKESQLKNKQKSLKLKANEALQWDDNIHKLMEQAAKIKESYQKNCKERQFKFETYKSHVGELCHQQQSAQERRQRTFQLLSMESNDILDAKNVVLRDVLLTNKALDKMLEHKISDLLSHYQQLQNCYHMIKTEANIADPQSLVQKFFSYSQSFQELTSRIKGYEARHDELLEKNKALRQIQTEKETRKLEEERSLVASIDNMHEQRERAYQDYLERELAVRKVAEWVDRINDSLGPMRSKSEAYPDKMQEICAYITSRAQQTNSICLSDQKFETPGIRLKKVLKDLSIQDEKLKRTEAQELIESNICENTYISYERKKVKKNQFLIKTQPHKMAKHE